MPIIFSSNFSFHRFFWSFCRLELLTGVFIALAAPLRHEFILENAYNILTDQQLLLDLIAQYVISVSLFDQFFLFWKNIMVALCQHKISFIHLVELFQGLKVANAHLL